MIDEPKVSMMVVAVNGGCDCKGHTPGTVGFINFIENPDQFLVKDHQGEDAFWHCKDCVTKLK